MRKEEKMNRFVNAYTTKENVVSLCKSCKRNPHKGGDCTCNVDELTGRLEVECDGGHAITECTGYTE